MKVIVKLLSGKQIPFEGSPQTTIMDLKKYIKKVEGINPEFQLLIFGGNHLFDENTFGYYGIMDGDYITLVNKTIVEENKELKIVIKCPDGIHIHLNVPPEITIAKIKEILSKKKGISPEVMHLFFCDKIIEDYKTLSDIGLSKGGCFQLATSQKGGNMDSIKGPSLKEIEQGEEQEFALSCPAHLTINYGFSILGNCNNKICSLATNSNRTVAKTIGFGCWSMNDILYLLSTCPLCEMLFDPTQYLFYNCFYVIFGKKKDTKSKKEKYYNSGIKEAPKKKRYFRIKVEPLNEGSKDEEKEIYEKDHLWIYLNIIAEESKSKVEENGYYKTFLKNNPN